MPFVLPQFPLAINIWRLAGVGGNYAIPDVKTVGNLTPGRRVFLSQATAPSIATYSFFMELLLPKLTDIRPSWNGQGPDIVEVPDGSLRFYRVFWVDDIGKGFANEHRFAVLCYFPSFPQPVGSVGFPIGSPVPLP
jgi:hypothetical protein